VAAAETARLIAELVLKDKLSPGVKTATASIGRLETSLGRIGGIAKKGAQTAITNLAKIGAVAGIGIAAAVKGGLEDLATLESAVTSVDGAIRQMGLTGAVTGAQIATWANEIEADVGAAFDDPATTQATTTLIRFGKTTPENIRPAMEVITDLATKTGDVDSAATLLAKALADPTKAAGKLARAGVILTKAEQEQIVAFTKAGKAGEAQRVVLDAVARSTEGAALASQGPYAQALAKLADVSEDARKALAVGFLPVITKVADLLSKELAKPATMQNIREFGNTLAGGLDSLVEIARNLPWKTIGDSLKLAGSGAKAVLDAFTKMPPWVQTAVLTGWGLNKLTGGALSGIVGELSKGLVKGVLGISAGVVNLKAATVIGGPGGGGSPITPAAVGGIAGVIASMGGMAALASVSASLVPAALMLAAPYIFQGKPGSGRDPVPIQSGNRAWQQVGEMLPGWIANAGSKSIVPKLPERLPGEQTKQGTPAGDATFIEGLGKKITPVADAVDRSRTETLDRYDKMNATATDTKARVEAVKQQTATSGMTVANATTRGASTVASAVRASRPIVTTNVSVNVTASTVTRSINTQTRYGSGTGSAGGHAPGRGPLE
jgi:uncharacterized protein with GYD domain